MAAKRKLDLRDFVVSAHCWSLRVLPDGEKLKQVGQEVLNLVETRRSAQKEIVEALGRLTGAKATFLEHPYFSVAIRFFQTMRQGATNMLDPTGELSPENVDKFHNYADETMRCLGQMEADNVESAWFKSFDPKAEQEVRKKMSWSQQKDIAAAMRKELGRLKKLANDVQGLEEVALAKVQEMDVRQFQAHVVRVLVKIDVVLNSFGLGPVNTNMNLTGELRKNLVAVRVAADALVDGKGNLDPGRLQELDAHFERGIQNAEIVSQSLRPMQLKENGSRGKLVMAELEGLREDVKILRRSQRGK